MKPEELAAEAFRLAAAGEVEASRPKWRRALDLARFASGPEAAVEVGLRWAEAEWRWGDPERAKRLARQQAELARRKGVRGPSLVRAELLLGRLAGDRSALEKALAHLVQATERAEGGEAPAGAAEWLDLALALASLAMWTQAEEAYGAAVKYALAGREKAKAWWGLGEVRYRLGRPREALEPARRALREARRTGQEDLVPELLGNMMSYLAEAGQVRRARRIWAVLERSPLPAGWERRRGAEVARVLWESGEHEEASTMPQGGAAGNPPRSRPGPA
ncbi:MAG: hypothetical protein QJR08_01045 [Bacillota bacterium]|nr:hypothetical protein [Bacillota bacterium]